MTWLGDYFGTQKTQPYRCREEGQRHQTGALYANWRNYNYTLATFMLFLSKTDIDLTTGGREEKISLSAAEEGELNTPCLVCGLCFVLEGYVKFAVVWANLTLYFLWFFGNFLNPIRFEFVCCVPVSACACLRTGLKSCWERTVKMFDPWIHSIVDPSASSHKYSATT